MKELHDLVESLTCYHEGSCRDVNFLDPTWEGVDRFVASIDDSFERSLARDIKGRAFEGQVSTLLASGEGTAYLVFKSGTGVLRQLQVFVACEDDGLPFIELTFFPESVVQSPALKQVFTEWVKGACRLLQASQLFVRFENASWTLGDTGRHSGVFLVSGECRGDA